MVMHHVHSKIHELRQRPTEDREAIASFIAVGVVVVLLAGWVIFFARGVANSLPHAPQGSAVTNPENPDTAAVPVTPSAPIVVQSSTTPVSQMLVGTAASTTPAPMNDDSAQATVKALMQIANGH